MVGIINECGKNAHRFSIGERIGVAWIGGACGQCEYCLAGFENLCQSFVATGRDINGGYAEWMVINEKLAFHLPDHFSDEQVAPLLCAGAIGYRAIRLANILNGHTIGLSGFGASGHLSLKLIRFLFPDSKIFVFARTEQERNFALQLGAAWAGNYQTNPPDQANAIIDTTPVWSAIKDSLSNLKPGGRLIINAIRKEPTDQDTLLLLNYEKHLWMEKEIKTVANITRSDIEQFLRIAATIRLLPEVQVYSFEQANQAIHDLKYKAAKGAKVVSLKN